MFFRNLFIQSLFLLQRYLFFIVNLSPPATDSQPHVFSCTFCSKAASCRKDRYVFDFFDITTRLPMPLRFFGCQNSFTAV